MSVSDFLVRNMVDEISESEKKVKALGMIAQAVGAILLSRMVKETKLSDEIIVSARQS